MMKIILTMMLVFAAIFAEAQEYFVFPDSTVQFKGEVNGEIKFFMYGSGKTIECKRGKTSDFKKDTTFISGSIWCFPNSFKSIDDLKSLNGTGYRTDKTNDIYIDGVHGVFITNGEGEITCKQEFELLFTDYLSNCTQNGIKPTMQNFVNNYYKTRNKKEKKQ